MASLCRRPWYLLWLRRQKRTGSTFCLVTRCNGRTNTSFSACALSHYGGCRRIPSRTFFPSAHPRCLAGNSVYRRSNAFYSSDHRRNGHRHQTSACVLNSESAWLYDACTRCRGVGCGSVSFDNPRIFQEPSLSLFRISHPCLSYE